MLFSRVLGDTTYRTALEPTLLLAALMLLHLGLLALALRRTALRDRVPLALGGYLGVVLIGGVIWLQSDGFNGTDHFIRRVFWPLLLTDSTALSMGVASVLGAFWLIRRSGLLGAVAVLSGVGLFYCDSHWEKLNHHRVLPVAAVQGPPFFHIGHERTPTFRLAYEAGWDYANFEGWQLDGPTQTLRADRPQRFPLVVRAATAMVQLETRLVVQALEDRQEAQPLLPLAVGNTWELAVDSICRYRSGNVTHERYRQFLRITGTEESDGLHKYVLQQGITLDANQPVAELFAAGGATYFVGQYGQTEPAIEPLGGDRCQLNFLGSELKGTCIRGRPGSDIALSGPLRYTMSSNVTAGARALTAIVTLGFVKPEQRECQLDYELVRSSVMEPPAGKK